MSWLAAFCFAKGESRGSTFLDRARGIELLLDALHTPETIEGGAGVMPLVPGEVE